MIRVEYYGLIRSLVGVREEMIEAKRVVEVINEIDTKYGSKVAIASKRSFILINGENAALINGFRTKLKPGDVVKIMPVTAGG